MTTGQTVTKTLPTSYMDTTYIVALTAHCNYAAQAQSNNSVSTKTTSTYTCTSGQTNPSDLMFITIGYF